MTYSVIFTSTAVAHLCMSTSVVVVLLYIAILCVSAHVCVCVCACVRACVRACVCVGSYMLVPLCSYSHGYTISVVALQ